MLRQYHSHFHCLYTDATNERKSRKQKPKELQEEHACLWLHVKQKSPSLLMIPESYGDLNCDQEKIILPNLLS